MLGWIVVWLIAGAGVFAGLNTMYGAVVGRIRELSTLQAMGYRRKAITLSLIQEAALLSIGGALIASILFTSSVAADENLIYTHLDFLQRARGADDVGTVTMLEVHLSKEADVELVSTAIDEHYRGGPVGTSTRTKGMYQADTLADLAELIGFIHWLGYACVGLVLALVATTTVMSVQDRIKEHAVLQTLGLRPVRIFRLVIAESVILSTVGGLVGVALGVLVLRPAGKPLKRKSSRHCATPSVASLPFQFA